MQIMRILFRTDASMEVATGHVMRCLTLADALVDAGHAVRFVCRAHQGHLAQRINMRGYKCDLLALEDAATLLAGADAAQTARRLCGVEYR